MFLLQQISPKSVKNILEDKGVQERLKEVNHNLFSGSTPLTDSKFLILGFAFALSIYLSKVSKELTSSIIHDIDQERYSQAEQKSRDLVLVIIGNILFVWLLVIVPTIWMISHWFLTLSPTGNYFTIMRWWLFLGIILGTAYGFYIVVRKVFRQINTIAKTKNDIKYKRNF